MTKIFATLFPPSLDAGSSGRPRPVGIGISFPARVAMSLSVILGVVVFGLVPSAAWADIAPSISPLPIPLRSAWILMGVAVACSLTAFFILWKMAGTLNPDEEAGRVSWVFAGLPTVLTLGALCLLLLSLPFFMPIYSVCAFAIGLFALFRRSRIPSSREQPELFLRRRRWGLIFWGAALVLGLTVFFQANSTIQVDARQRSRRSSPSWVRADLQNLRTALLNFQADVGRLPHLGEEATPESILAAESVLLGMTEETNILVNPDAGGEGVASPPMGIPDFKRRWRGPYMDTAPSQFMADGYGTRFHLVWHEERIYLHSVGADLASDPIGQVLQSGYTGDDQALAVSRVRPVSPPGP